MKEIPINDAEDGVVLAKPVLDRNGNILLQEGNELTAISIERMKARGIDFLVVKDENDAELSPDEKERLSREIDSSLDEMFSDTMDSQIMVEIKSAASRHLKKQLDRPIAK